MFPTAKHLMIGAVVAAAMGLCVSQAEAQWGWGYGTCYSPCYTVGCYSYGGCYLGVRPGPVRRLLFGRYRWYCDGWYGGCYGGWGCCSTCCWDPCCCWDSCCCDNVVVYSSAEPAAAEQPTPTESKPAAKAPEAPTPPQPGALPGPVPPSSGASPAGKSGAGAGNGAPSLFEVDTRSNSGLLTVYVPVGAKVWINGRLTASTGSQRRYVSYGLVPGYRYKYEVRAQIRDDDKMLEQSKTVYLTAGANEGVAFAFNKPPASATAGK
jgi:uncharacterized protein (TIGR03000 family)